MDKCVDNVFLLYLILRYRLIYSRETSAFRSHSQANRWIAEDLPLGRNKGPQQRIFALQVYPLSGLYHAASLGAVRLGSLNRCDQIVRAEVRKWLDLLADISKAYFHSDICSRGLGVSSLL